MLILSSINHFVVDFDLYLGVIVLLEDSIVAMCQPLDRGKVKDAVDLNKGPRTSGN